MHDPETLIWGSRYIDLWHKDPCLDGSDNSCGWSYVKTPAELREKVRALGESEQVFITGKHGYAMQPSELVMEVWQTIAARMFNRPRWRGRGLTHRELVYVLNLANNPGDNLRYSCGNAGSPEGMGSLFVIVLRCYLTFHRKWWQHPRWHVRHWRIRVRLPRFLARITPAAQESEP
jgi:hypothetical protein